MTKQPRVTVGLRLPPSTKAELGSLVGALKDKGESVRREDVVGALLRRAVAFTGDSKALDKLGADARAHRARAKTEGF
jgi:hypothetical protein